MVGVAFWIRDGDTSSAAIVYSHLNDLLDWAYRLNT